MTGSGIVKNRCTLHVARAAVLVMPKSVSGMIGFSYPFEPPSLLQVLSLASFHTFQSSGHATCGTQTCAQPVSQEPTIGQSKHVTASSRDAWTCKAGRRECQADWSQKQSYACQSLQAKLYPDAGVDPMR